MKFGLLIIGSLVSISMFVMSDKKNSTMQKVKIEIWSDVACPFCYLGKKKLEKAITNLGVEDELVIEWKSFQLDPSIPKDSAYPSIQYLSETKGFTVSQVKNMCDQLELQGVNYGIEYNFGNALTVNTFDMHRLLQWSKQYNKTNELKQAFIHAYFSEGIDLSQSVNLLKLVEGVGLDRVGASEVLNSYSYAEDVSKDIQEAQKLGVRGVPYFLIDQKQAVSGAQDVKVFEDVLKAALIKNELDTIETTSGFCSPNKECE